MMKAANVEMLMGHDLGISKKQKSVFDGFPFFKLGDLVYFVSYRAGLSLCSFYATMKPRTIRTSWIQSPDTVI